MHCGIYQWYDKVPVGGKKWPWRLRSHVEFSATSLSERSLFKWSPQPTMRGIREARAELLIGSFIEKYFPLQAQIKFYSLKFLWFQGCSTAWIFCPSRAPCFKLPYLHGKGEPIKTLRCIFIAHHPFSMPTHLPYISVWAWLWFCLQIISEVGHMTVFWLRWLTLTSKRCLKLQHGSFFGLKC